MEETRLTVVNTLDQLSDLNSILLKEREIAVDLEVRISNCNLL